MTKILILKFVWILAINEIFTTPVKPSQMLEVYFSDIFSDIDIEKVDFTTLNPAKIQFDRLNITVFGADETNFENALAQSMNETYHFYNNKSKDDIFSLATPQLSETAADAATLLKRMLDSVPKNSSGDNIPRRSLKKCMQNEIDTRIMTDKIDLMKLTVKFLIEILESIATGDVNEIAYKLAMIDAKLSDIIDEFIGKTSKFRQYPEVMADSFLAIATVYNRLYAVFLAHNQPNDNTKVLPCKLASALEDYRDFYSSWRLSQIRTQYMEFKDRPYPKVECTPQVAEIEDVLRKPFSRTGYTNYLIIYWVHNGCTSGSTLCIDDHVDGNVYEANGYKNFLYRIRHKMEKFFQRPIDTSTDICEKFSDEYFKLPKYPTGYGWLQVRSQFFLRPVDRWGSYEELAAAFTIDGIEIQRTSTTSNCTIQLVDIIFTTTRIEKSDRIEFIVYENKTEFGGVISAPIGMILERGSGKEFIKGVLLWKDEFSTDPVYGTTQSTSSLI